MARYIDAEHLFKCETCRHHRSGGCDTWCENGECYSPDMSKIPTADVVEVVRCKDCIHATELDKHCVINRSAYRHCVQLRGEEEKNVWHRYGKNYKDYSLVELDDFCSYGKRKEGEKDEDLC